MEKKQAVLKRSYKPSPQKMYVRKLLRKQAYVFPAAKPTTSSRVRSKGKENFHTPKTGFACLRIDKETVFEELQHVKDEILELQCQNKAMWEQNGLLQVSRELFQKHLVHAQYQRSASTKDEKLLKSNLSREVGELKRRGDLQLAELEKLKKSPMYTTYLELEVEKKVLEERLDELRDRIREGRHEKQTRIRYNKQLGRKIEERDALLQRMKEGVQRENAKLKEVLRSLQEDNSKSEARLRELKGRNARYHIEIGRLKEEAELRHSNSRKAQDTSFIVQALAVRWVRRHIKLEDLVQQLLQALKPAGKIAKGRLLCELEIGEVGRLLAADKADEFIDRMKTSWKTAKEALSQPLGVSESEQQAVRKWLTSDSSPSVSGEELQRLLKALKVRCAFAMYQLIDAAACQSSVKLLDRQRLIDCLGHKPEAALPKAPELVRPPSRLEQRPASQAPSRRCDILGSSRNSEQGEGQVADLCGVQDPKRVSEDEAYEQEFEESDCSGESKDVYKEEFEQAVQPQKPSRHLCISEIDEDTTRKKFSKESRDESSMAYSEVIGDKPTRPRQTPADPRPIEPSIKVFESWKALEQNGHSEIEQTSNVQLYRKMYEASAASLSESIASSQGIHDEIGGTAARVERELKAAQARIVQQRVAEVARRSQQRVGSRLISNEDLGQLQQIPEQDILAELQFQAVLQAKVMLESLYSKLAEKEHSSRCSDELQRARGFLQMIYEQVQERVQEAEEECCEDHGIRDFIGGLYRKITDASAINADDTDSVEDIGEFRDSKFIEKYLNAFSRNFSFV